MDSKKVSSGHGIETEKLTESNFLDWKQKISLILTYQEVYFVVHEQNGHRDGTSEYENWIQCDKLSQANIGFFLWNDVLEHVRGMNFAKEMFAAIKNVFQRHTFLKEHGSRRDLYTMKWKVAKNVVLHRNRVQQLESILKGMKVAIDEKKFAMTIFNRLPIQHGSIITSLDAIDDDSDLFTAKRVKSWLLQKDQRGRAA